MRLLENYRIKNIELRNRIIMPAIHLGFSKDGYVSEQLIEFYKERANGGVGLILVGGINPAPYPVSLDMEELGDDKYISGHSKLVTTVHNAGAKIGAQLLHPGRNARSNISKKQPIAPSAIPSPLTREMPREMTLDDIKEVIDHFASAARRVQVAGYDLVEIIAAGGYLINSFYSPITNIRTDHYGGSLENRSRFGVELIQAVRETVGVDYPIMVRLSGSDFIPGGNTNTEVQQFALRLQAAGADAFNITGGWHESKVPQITMNVPAGAYVYLAKGIKQAVEVPVIACNRINDPMLAEEILEQGSADLVGMARALIADPELPKKFAEGRQKEIRKCVGCNQGCLDRIMRGKSCTCLVNPRVGRERELPIVPAASRKKVLVVGGGVAGMETARVAATRGHEVRLWEKSDLAGGALRKAGMVPDRTDLLDLLDYLIESLSVLGVKMEFNKEANLDGIKSFAPDVVVLATGSKPVLPSIPGIELEHVLEAGELLLGKVKGVGRKVVIIGGGAVGCEMGIFIAKQGTINSDIVKFLLLNEAETAETIKKLATLGTKEIVILEMDETAGKGLGISTRWSMMQDLKRMGVKILTSTLAQAIKPDGVVITGSDGKMDLLPADSIVIAVGSSPENGLYEELLDEVAEVHLVGDAKRVRTALEAIREGFIVGNSI